MGYQKCVNLGGGGGGVGVGFTKILAVQELKPRLGYSLSEDEGESHHARVFKKGP